MDKDIFRNQVAIITGASSGIGRALALQLARKGAKVVLAARRVELLEQVAAECRQNGGEALVVPTDVTDEIQCKQLVDRTVEKFGRVDLLVNNAGLTVVALLEWYRNLDLFRHTMEVNFYGGVYCTYYALPYLKKSRGRIAALSSLGGKAALPYNTAYVASKHAMQGFYDSLRMELKKHGVSVTVISPSWVMSGFHEAQLNRDGVPAGPRGRGIYTRRTMTSERCAEISLRAIANRRREVLMSPGWLAVWLKFLSPGLLDWFVETVFLGSAIRRAKKKATKE